MPTGKKTAHRSMEKTFVRIGCNIFVNLNVISKRKKDSNVDVFYKNISQFWNHLEYKKVHLI